MGMPDAATTIYMARNKIFADAFNAFVYNGEQVIDPAELAELDSKEVEVPYGHNGAKQPVQRTRDVIKELTTAKTDHKRAYLVMAIENQKLVHNAMPVRNMLYDGIQYATQINKATQSHRDAGDLSGDEEYLSGLSLDDKLMPVITLVIYFGPEVWNAPLSLYEMFEEQAPEVLALVPDYKINLIAPAMLDDADFDKFHTSLKEVLTFIKYSNDAEKLQEVLRKNEAFCHMGWDEVAVLNSCVNAKIKNKKGKEGIDLCKAIYDITTTAEAKGRAEAQVEVDKANAKAQQESERADAESERADAESERADAEAAARIKAEEELEQAKTSMLQTTVKCLKVLMDKQGLSALQAMEEMQLPERDRQAVSLLL